VLALALGLVALVAGKGFYWISPSNQIMWTDWPSLQTQVLRQSANEINFGPTAISQGRTDSEFYFLSVAPEAPGRIFSRSVNRKNLTDQHVLLLSKHWNSKTQQYFLYGLDSFLIWDRSAQTIWMPDDGIIDRDVVQLDSVVTDTLYEDDDQDDYLIYRTDYSNKSSFFTFRFLDARTWKERIPWGTKIPSGKFLAKHSDGLTLGGPVIDYAARRVYVAYYNYEEYTNDPYGSAREIPPEQFADYDLSTVIPIGYADHMVMMWARRSSSPRLADISAFHWNGTLVMRKPFPDEPLGAQFDSGW